MTKQELDLCREIIGMFNKATFNVTGIELAQFATRISSFAKMILEKEKELNAPTLPAKMETHSLVETNLVPKRRGKRRG